MATNNATNTSNPVAATQGGTGTATYATGDILYASATNVLSKLAAGTNGNVLTLAAGVPSWALSSSLASFQIFTSGSAATYTLPAGIKTILVECIGGGGGGGGVSTAVGQTSAAGGGGAGGYSRKFYSAPAGTYTYTIGTGGAGGTAGVHNGTTGNATTFDVITCNGGVGGPADTASLSIHISATTVGFGGTATGGDINYTGTPGGMGVGTLINSFGGAGGSGIYGGGGAAAFAGGGTSVAGNGGNTNSGSGGAGAASNNVSSDKAGGAGGDGIIVVWQFA